MKNWKKPAFSNLNGSAKIKSATGGTQFVEYVVNEATAQWPCASTGGGDLRGAGCQSVNLFTTPYFYNNSVTGPDGQFQLACDSATVTAPCS